MRGCCFNGALPIQAGRRLHHRRLPPCASRFNGALPIQAGRPVVVGCDRAVGTDASMEPCQFRRGDSSDRLRRCLDVIASMEPCQFRRGDLPSFNDGKTTVHALQWSPANSGGETCAGVVMLLNEVALQWSPANSGGETCLRLMTARRRSMRFNGALPIQAGRPASSRNSTPRRPLASMEPCQFRRGDMTCSPDGRVTT